MCTIIRLSLVVLVSGLFLVSCATTKVTKVWKDETYAGGPVKNVFIIGVLANPDMRHFFEEEFADQLRARGIQAVPSHKYISLEKKVSEEEVASKVRQLSADSVVVARSVGRSLTETAAPGDPGYGPGPDLYGYYSSSLDYFAGPGFGYTQDIMYVETKLFEVKNRKPVWAAQSKMQMDGRRTEIIKSYVKDMVDALSSSRLLK